MMFILVWNLIRENLFLSIVYLTGNCMIIQARDQNEKLYSILFLWRKVNSQCIEIDSSTTSNAAALLSTPRKFFKKFSQTNNSSQSLFSALHNDRCLI